MITRRSAIVLIGAMGSGAPLQAAETSAWSALKAGGIVLFRHAIAPGTGDPPGFRIGDCATQRNLDAAGRAQAKRIGAAFRSRGVSVGRVVTSQWCRAVDTAALAFPGQATTEATFNSFFDDRASEAQQTAAARAYLAAWQGPGALVVVTHQVNVTALTGVVPGSGEGVVVKPAAGRLTVVGRLPF